MNLNDELKRRKNVKEITEACAEALTIAIGSARNALADANLMIGNPVAWMMGYAAADAEDAKGLICQSVEKRLAAFGVKFTRANSVNAQKAAIALMIADSKGGIKTDQLGRIYDILLGDE